MDKIKGNGLYELLTKAKTIGTYGEVLDRTMRTIVESKCNSEINRFNAFVEKAKPMHHKLFTGKEIHGTDYVQKYFEEMFEIQYGETTLSVVMGFNCGVLKDSIESKANNKQDITDEDTILVGTELIIQMYSTEKNKAMKIAFSNLTREECSIDKLCKEIGTGERNEVIEGLLNVFENLYNGEEDFKCVVSYRSGAAECTYTIFVDEDEEIWTKVMEGTGE